MGRLLHLSLEKRPGEELYVLPKDLNQLHNVPKEPKYASIKKNLQAQLQRWRQQTPDPALANGGNVFDEYAYYGNRKNGDRK